MAGEGGRDDSRGAQTKLSSRNLDAADTEEADPGSLSLCQEGTDTLSQRGEPEFLGIRESKAGTDACREILWMSKSR